MKTTAIRYGRLRSIAGFANVRLEKEVELRPHENEADVLKELKADVEKELGIMVEQISYRQERDDLKEEIARLLRERDDLRAEIEVIRETGDG